jgi:hypothetical protein
VTHFHDVPRFNPRHFRKEHLARWGVVAFHAASLLAALYQRQPGTLTAKLREQAADRSRSLAELLGILVKTVPKFVELVSSNQST